MTRAVFAERFVVLLHNFADDSVEELQERNGGDKWRSCKKEVEETSGGVAREKLRSCKRLASDFCFPVLEEERLSS
ncbi:unnamed protein product [Cyprideis torosa]|uniref:Uncharacterized protein n=1 Tax=Cyprideis torosa TaxID=163714 RepID=A0A7R8W2E2_9CRUS|nr:unnamed protein product [Cyprideis torosa]CAG0881853.1 unnamed protein product [Cyprideis torosa]